VDCPSCGAKGQTKARCEACGFTFPSESVSAADDALSLVLGLVCAACDAYNDPGTTACASCGTPIDVVNEGAIAEPAAPLPPLSPLTVSSAMTAPPSWMTPPTGNTLSTQFAMKKVDLASISGGGLAAPKETDRKVPDTLPPPETLPPLHTEPPSPPSPLPQMTKTVPLPAAQTPSTQAAQAAQPSTPAKALCWRCSTDLEPHDKFCRNCGARTDGGPGGAGMSTSTAPAGATQVMPAMKLGALPNLPGLAVGAPGATQVLPAMRGAQAAAAPQPSTTMFFGAATVERVAKLILVRGHSQFGNQWRMQSGETVIGRARGMVLFPDDTALAEAHARLVFRGPDLFLEPEPTQNGVYLRIREPQRLQPGDEFIVGAQRLRVQEPNERPQMVVATSDAHETRMLGSMVKQNPPIALIRIAADPRFHEVFYRAQRLLTIGRVNCDINFASDGFVSERHAQLTHEGTHILLEDLRSRNGTYARVTSSRKLAHGDLLLMGDQVLRIELPR
jgi:pSer/pThr/pTyr-binding forkhead associated (FHA) protein